MDEYFRCFLTKWALAGVIFIALLVALNVMVDPYMVIGVPRVAGFNARKPSIETHTYLLKAYDVLRADPRTVLLGTSTVGLGIDANDAAWPSKDRPVYNLSIQGRGPYTAFRYLQHIASRTDLDLVVMGLDFNFFLDAPDPVELGPEFEQRLAVLPDGQVNTRQAWQRIRDVLQTTFSLDTVSESVVTLSANVRGESPNIVAGNWENSGYFRFIAQTGGRYVSLWDRRIIDLYRGKQVSPKAMESVKAIIHLCETRRIRLILFISPIHADELEVLDVVGSWKNFEDWKRGLVALASERPPAGSDVTVSLWDFSEYDAYSTESPSEDATMRWFRDSSHYSRELGRVIVQRILGGGDVHFGSLLSLETLDARLLDIQRQRDLYRKEKPHESQRVRDLYKSMYADVQ